MTEDCFSCRMGQTLDQCPPSECIVTFPGWRLAHARSTSVEGWVILVAQRHLTTLEQLSEAEAASLGLAQRQVARAHRHVLGATKTYSALFTEAVAHLHVHLVPRMDWFTEDQLGPAVMALLSGPEEARVPRDRMVEVSAQLGAFLKADHALEA